MNRKDTANNNLLLVIEECGLSASNPVDLLDTVFRLTSRQIRKYAESLSLALPDPDAAPDSDPFDFFNFLASSTLRGDSGCTAWPCQTAKLTSLAQFTALYADRVVFPIDFMASHPNVTQLRFEFFRALNAVSVLRPLIEAGIVYLAPATSCVCKTCLSERGVNLRRIEANAKRFWRDRADRFKIIYRPPTRHSEARLEIDGPADYLPHGHIEVDLYRPLEPPPKRLKIIGEAPGFAVSKTLAAEKKILSDMVFSEFETDLIVQQVHGLRFGATYLTDCPGEAEFFGGLQARDELAANAARFCSHLSHSIPLLSEAPTSSILRIRAEEPEAFIQYRSALNSIVKEHVRPGTFLDDTKANELFHDVLRPRITRLKSEANAKLRSSRRKVAAKLACSFAAISLGVISGFLPSELAKLFTAIGGVNLLRDIGEAIADIRRYPNELRNNDLFFLLKLPEETHN